MRTADEWKGALRSALKEAMRARSPDAVAVLRETLAAIDNAEAADLATAPAVEPGVIAGGVSGLGAGEVARRTLSPEEAAAVVEREREERRHAADTFERLGRTVEAERLRAQLEVLRSVG